MVKNEDRIAIYSRKSRFTGKGESIGNQVELCREYIRTTFGEDCAARALVFEDEGFSGGNLNRPDFRRMMQAARERRFRAVVVYRLDRISRNIGDFSALIQELGQLGIDFVSIRESFDTSSPMGRAMMYIASVFSQLERETIAERIRDNMRELAKTGRWLGGVTPTGYTSEAVRSVTVEGRSKRCCRLKLIPEEAELVRTIFALYLKTDSLTGTEAELLHRNLKTKNGREFTRFSIKSILQNPVYLIADREAYQYFLRKQADLFSPPGDFDGTRGILAYNRTDQEKGRAAVFLPVSRWIVAVGQHPGLIPGRTWVQVQDSLERNRCRAYRKPRRNEALLTGLLRCGCGGRMYPKLTRQTAENGTSLYRYVCRQKERSKGVLCSSKNAAGNGLDAAVLEQLAALAEDTPALLHRLEAGCRFPGADPARQREELCRQQTVTQRRIAALVDALADLEDSTASGPVRLRIEELHRQNAALEARLRQMDSPSSCPVLPERELERECHQLASFADCVCRMTLEQKRALMRALVYRADWDGQCARVALLGAPPEGGVLPAACAELPTGAASPRRETLWGEDSK